MTLGYESGRLAELGTALEAAWPLLALLGVVAIGAWAARRRAGIDALAALGAVAVSVLAAILVVFWAL